MLTICPGSDTPQPVRLLTDKGTIIMQADGFGFGTQIRKSPYFDATVRWGAKGFSVYNHMYIPRDFGDPEQNFWNLVNDATVLGHGFETARCAGYAAILTPVAASGSRPFCSALI